MNTKQNEALTALINVATKQLDTGSSYIGMVNCAIIHNARRALLELAVNETITTKKPMTKKQARKVDFIKLAGRIDKRNKKINLGILIKDGKAIVSDLDRWLTFSTDHKDGSFKYSHGVMLQNDTIHEIPPSPDMGEHKASVALNTDMLRGALLATSKDETRRAIMGVLIGVENGKFYCVATDGRRLHLWEKPYDEATEGEKWELTLPRETIEDLLTLHDGDFTLDIYKAHIWTGGTGWAYLSRVQDTVYPNFRQVIPKEQGHHFKVNNEAFVEGIKNHIMPMVKSQKGKADAVRLIIENGELTARLTLQNGQEAKFTIPCDHSAPLSAVYNPYYLIDLIEASPAGSVFWFEDHASPVSLKAGEYTGVLMPVRLN